MKYISFPAVGLLLLLYLNAVSGSILVEQPARSFGYVVGDVLMQRIKLELHGRSVELSELPTLQRVGPWLQRRIAKLERDALNQTWLVVQYQVINSPVEPIVAATPALRLGLIESESLRVDAWPFSISPLSPVSAVDEQRLPPMRPDHAAIAPDTQVLQRQLRWSSILLLVILVVWLGWWLWRRQADIKRLPFARAYYDLRNFERRAVDANPEAWLTLHRAFNRAGGRCIHSSSITELVRQQPWMKSMQSRIEAFYSASDARFFEQSPQPPAFALGEFCRHLYLAEKRHADARQVYG